MTNNEHLLHAVSAISEALPILHRMPRDAEKESGVFVCETDQAGMGK